MSEKKLSGIGVSDGIVIGKVLKLNKINENYEYKNIDNDEVKNELMRLSDAKEKCNKDLNKLIEKVRREIGDDKAVILEGQKGFLTDPSFYTEIEANIENKLYSAEKALNEVVEKYVKIFENMQNDYMKERSADIKDIGKRLFSYLTSSEFFDFQKITEKVVLIADDLMPSDIVQLDKKYILAIATNKGGKTSHTAIFANSMGIPAIMSVNNICNLVENNDNIIVNGDKGICIIKPEEDTIKLYEENIRNIKVKFDLYNKYKEDKAITKDGFEMKIAANIGSFEETVLANKENAESIGLFRTEQLFMSNDSLPDEEKQFTEYKNIVEEMNEKSVIIRTLDIGGDKELPYLKIPKELNPFLGYRAIRLCLDNKEIFITQLRAIFRASAYGKIKILIPMISCIDELREAKDLIEKVKNQLSSEKIAFDKNIEIGMMIEVPSTAIMIEHYAYEVDFFSIGTNDLIQYTVAVDRTNEKVAHLYDELHPAVISLIKNVATISRLHNKSVGICGNAAGNYLLIPLFVALDIDELSMPSVKMSKVKYIVNQINKSDCLLLLNTILKCKNASEIKLSLENFIKDNKIIL